MSITTTELDESGPISIGEQHEIRTRSFRVFSNDPLGDGPLNTTESVLRLGYATNRPDGLNIPRRDELWTDWHPDFQPGVDPDRVTLGAGQGRTWANPHGIRLDDSEPSELEITDELRCISLSCVQMGQILEDQALFKVTATYSTKPSLYRLQRNFEVSTVADHILFDKDAISGKCSVNEPPNCLTWKQVQAIPNLTIEQKYALAQIGRTSTRVEGVDSRKPLMVMTWRKHCILNYTREMVALSYLVGTINACKYPDMDVEETWLLLGVNAQQVRGRIYDIEAKFAYDQNFHRAFFYMNQPGTDVPAIPALTGYPACRSYRIYERGYWDALIDMFGVRDPWIEAECDDWVQCDSVQPPPPPDDDDGGTGT